MISFDYLEPTSIDEALELLAIHGEDAKLIAGGTGLVNLMKQRLVQPRYVIGLRRLPGLNVIHNGAGLNIGALTTYREISESPLVQERAPLLAEACRVVANIRIRSIATIGGGLAHADPNQDPPPALIALDARIALRSASGERELAAEDFFTGYYETALEPGEIVTDVRLPAQPANSGAVYLKFLPRTQDDYATVAAAARLTVEGGRISGARVAVGAAGDTPLRLGEVESALVGKPAEAATFADAAGNASIGIAPVSDFRGSAEYKRAMIPVFVRRALEQAAAKATGSRG